MCVCVCVEGCIVGGCEWVGVHVCTCYFIHFFEHALPENRSPDSDGY